MPGTFLMGSPDSEPGRYDYAETPVHQVTLTHAFQMLSTEVTQAQFQSRMGYNPSSHASCGPNCPEDRVNWYEAAAYTNALSLEAGLRSCYDCVGEGPWLRCGLEWDFRIPYECPGYRLPTEAEWEYAARAGTTGATYNGTWSNDGTCDAACLGEDEADSVLDPIAWYRGNSGGVPHPVGLKMPNAWGLFDILGNVNEWCADSFHTYSDYPSGALTDPWSLEETGYRVVRGGCANCSASVVRSAFRIQGAPEYGRQGLRPVRTLLP